MERNDATQKIARSLRARFCNLKMGYKQDDETLAGATSEILQPQKALRTRCINLKALQTTCFNLNMRYTGKRDTITSKSAMKRNDAT